MTEDVVLRAEGLSLSFPGVVAFSEISFTLHRREVLAIVGPSGCGKSSLFNVIAGLQAPGEGRVEVLGRPVEGAIGHVGYMLQKDLLLPWRNVLDNVLLGLEVRGVPRAEAEARARNLIETYGLKGFEKARPATLSGGMRQRVAFMRTLAPDPEVILLDEPFSALDFQTKLLLQREVQSIIRDRAKSAILVTHDIGEAIVMADRVLVLSRRPGRLKSSHVITLPAAVRDPVEARRTPEFQAYFDAIWADLDQPVEAP